MISDAHRDNGRLTGSLALKERDWQKGSFPRHFRVTDVYYDRSRLAMVWSLMNYAFDLARHRAASWVVAQRQIIRVRITVCVNKE